MATSYKEFCEKFNLPTWTENPKLKTLHTVWRFSLPIKVSELWPHIADTSRFNRELGLAPRQEREVEGKKIVNSKILGFKQEWIEEPWAWYHDRSIESFRLYNYGIAHSVRSLFFLEPTSTGVDLYVNFSWSVKNLSCYWFLKLTSSILEKKFFKALRKISDLVKNRNKNKPEVLKLTNPNSPVVNEVALAKAAQALKDKNIYPAAAVGLCEFIRSGDDIDLYRIKAINLAQNLNLPKKEVLKACMEGVRYGLLSMSWDVICPHCRGVRFEAESFGKIPASSDCLVCEVDFQTDTLESIEIVFHVQPTYRKVTEVLFCAAEPAKKDHIRVQEKLAPRQVLEFKQSLREGRHRIRVINPIKNYYFEVIKSSTNSQIHWDVDSDLETKTFAQQLSLKIENKTDQFRTFNLEQLWWKDDILHPADIFSIPEYQDVFSRDTLNSNIKISLGVQVIMFTDIVNSTQFYNEKGDAAAFNDVKNHFVESFEAIQKQEGSVIKTIGDSIMACFLDPDKALKAAMDIQNIFKKDRSDTSIRLRISLHLGQVIAVHLLQGLDLFGTTVNKAAKLQTCANAGEIAFSNEFLEACSPKILENCSPFYTKKTSNIIYKEVPLEAYVLNYHKMMDRFID